jgi:hypothetical protein
MKILIGCPIYRRHWILNSWIAAIKSQSYRQTDLGFVFEVAPDDFDTLNILNTWKKYDSASFYFEIKVRDDINHFEHLPNGRNWTISKYENMVNLRNSLLSTVRKIEPDYYFSLDSDILIQNPNTIELLVSHCKEGADAVSPLMFMTPTNDLYPSVMSWCGDGTNRAMRFRRYPLGTYFQSDVIMAAKMMTKEVYSNIDYSVHEQGEDVGWSYSCKEKGYRLFSASYIYAPHIMSQEMFNEFLVSGDNRLDNYNINYTI